MRASALIRRLDGVPSWVLPGASADIFFSKNQAWTRGGSNSLSSLLSTSRASTGYAQTTGGVLLKFAANTPRITDQGLLVEQASTNLVLQSAAFSNSAWNVSSAAPAIVSTNNLAPDGTLTAVRATVSSANNRFSQGVTVTNNQPVVFSVYVKAAPSSSATNVRISSNNGGSWNTGGDTVIALTNSWQRITMTYQNTFGTGITLFVGAVKSDSTNDATCYGDVLVWGGQFEANMAFATSPILTVASTVTRAADAITLSGAALTAALNAKAARFVTNLMNPNSVNSNDQLLYISGAPQGLRFAGNNALSADSGASAQASLGSGTFAGLVKSAFGYDATSYTVIGNGGTKGTLAAAWGVQSGSVFLGNRSALDRPINGYMLRATFSPVKGAFDLTTTAPGML